MEEQKVTISQIDDVTHSEINQAHQEYPMGSDIAKDMATHNSSIDEDDKQDIPNKGTHIEKSIPSCSTATLKANSSQKWDELHPSLQTVLQPDDDYSYVVETYHEINNESGDSPHFSATIRINLASENDAQL